MENVRIDGVDSLSKEQARREQIYREVGEVMLSIEMVQARVEKALDTLDKNGL